MKIARKQIKFLTKRVAAVSNSLTSKFPSFSEDEISKLKRGVNIKGQKLHQIF